MLSQPNDLFHQAGLPPLPGWRSLDALHLVTTVRMEADEVVTYDGRMIQAAHDLGLNTRSPA